MVVESTISSYRTMWSVFCVEITIRSLFRTFNQAKSIAPKCFPRLLCLALMSMFFWVIEIRWFSLFFRFYNRRVQGFNSVKDLYVKCSSSRRIKDIKIPTIFLNTLDDPLFPESSIRLVQRICATHKHHAFIELKYGGHLGFLEGWSFKPNSGKLFFSFKIIE
jgi:pimeloyl-ACP methyl ester carboxylesterase